MLSLSLIFIRLRAGRQREKVSAVLHYFKDWKVSIFNMFKNNNCQIGQNCTLHLCFHKMKELWILAFSSFCSQSITQATWTMFEGFCPSVLAYHLVSFKNYFFTYMFILLFLSKSTKKCVLYLNDHIHQLNSSNYIFRGRFLEHSVH